MNRKFLFLIIPFLLFVAMATAQTIRYVTVAGAGLKDGLSWATASDDIQLMINQSGPNDQVWVAAGTYKPNRKHNATGTVTPGDRNNAFVLKEDVQLFGGFAGNEVSLLQRDLQSNPTVLSGDFNGDDIISGTGLTLAITNNAENAYHVLISAGPAGTAAVDGFTISGGNGNGSSTQLVINTTIYTLVNAGAMLNVASSPAINNCMFTANTSTNGAAVSNNSASPVFNNCSFITNMASGTSTGYGAGMYNQASSPVLVNCRFDNNVARTSGGGIYNVLNSRPNLSHCQFTNNLARSSGGGMYNANNSSPYITNSVFRSNTADFSSGGGMYNNSSSAPTIINCLFAENISNSFSAGGGGMTNAASSNPLIVNCTFAGNTASNGSGLYNISSSLPVIHNSIIWGSIYTDENSGYTAQFSLMQGNTNTDAGNPDATPYTADNIFTNSLTGDYTLKPGSPAIEKGSNTLYAASYPLTDLAGNGRTEHPNIDMGAYEYSGALPVVFGNISAIWRNETIYVSWETLSETNNHHFEIEFSTDGVHFKKAATVLSKATGGNTSVPLHYELRLPANEATVLIGSAVLICAGLLLAGKRRQRTTLLPVLALAAMFFSCNRKDIALETLSGQQLYVRLVQVDIDGTKAGSKVVHVVRE
ncbi:MAG: right-handed parallel beta-helix repeat-containing protein [Niabella sp.]